MTRETCRKYVALTFQEFYRQVTLNFDYKFTGEKKEKVIDNFIDYIDEKYSLKSIGLEFIVNYFESGFNLWYDRENLKFGVKSIQIEWIIGKKAIERYEKIRDKDNKYFRKFRQIRKDLTLNVMSRIKSQINAEAIVALLKLNEREENEKRRFFGTEEGLLWCATETTMYNDKSELCGRCTYRLRCKRLLKDNMPNLYKKRGFV